MIVTGILTSGVLAFTWTAVLIELTPGPNMTTLAVLSASRGRRAGLAAVFGVALGLLIVGLLASLGLAAAVERSHLLYQVLRWAGVAYLMWLAWEGWREADGDMAGGLPNDADTTVACFRQGLITNLLNPKAGIFYLSVLPTFIDAGRPVAAQTTLLTLIYVAVATTIHLAIVLGADRARSLLVRPDWNRPVRRALALSLALVALWLAWSTGR